MNKALHPTAYNLNSNSTKENAALIKARRFGSIVFAVRFITMRFGNRRAFES